MSERKDYNGNTSHHCADCGVTPPVTLVQSVQVGKLTRHWHLCARCFLKRGCST